MPLEYQEREMGAEKISEEIDGCCTFPQFCETPHIYRFRNLEKPQAGYKI